MVYHGIIRFGYINLFLTILFCVENTPADIHNKARFVSLVVHETLTASGNFIHEVYDLWKDNVYILPALSVSANLSAARYYSLYVTFNVSAFVGRRRICVTITTFILLSLESSVEISLHVP